MIICVSVCSENSKYFINIVSYFIYNKTNNNKMTSLAPISSEDQSSVAHQNQRIRHSRDHVQCRKSSTNGWRCQEAKEDRQF